MQYAPSNTDCSFTHVLPMSRAEVVPVDFCALYLDTRVGSCTQGIREKVNIHLKGCA